MALDPKTIREAQEAYRRWNEAELRGRLHAANRPSAQEAWRQYVALIEFRWRLAPPQSEQRHALRIADLSRFYDRIHISVLTASLSH
jgi:hypothetical protein